MTKRLLKDVDPLITEDEWKRRFLELTPTKKAYVFGLWVARSRVEHAELPSKDTDVDEPDPVDDPEFADVVWKLREHVVDVVGERMRQQDKGPRYFECCPKCRNMSPQEALYVRRPDVNKSLPQTLLNQMERYWAHHPMEDLPFPDMADEGFFVRCGHCSYAWYEPMEKADG